MMRRTKRKALILFCLIAALAVGIVSPAGIGIPGIQAETVQAAEYRATTADLNMRAGQGVNYKIIKVIPAGKQVQILSKPSSWYRVSYNGTTGYVNSRYLKANATKTMAEDLNLRKTKSTASSANIIGVVKKGQKVTVLSVEADSWYRVSVNGKTGYIRGGHFTDDTSRMTKKSLTATPTTTKKKTTKTTKKVMAEALKMRSSKDKSSDTNVILIIPKGATVTIKAKEADNWYKIKYKKKTGYIKGGHFTDDKSRMGLGSVKPYTKVTRTALNLRRSASSASSSNIITTIPAGKTVTVTGKEAYNWLAVTYAGVKGYVKNGYFR